MLRTIRVGSFCLALLSCCALLSTLSPAATASSAFQTPANHAQPLLTSKIDDSKVAPIPFFGLPATQLPEAQGAKDLGRADAGKVIGMELDLRRGRDQISALTALRNHAENPNDPMYGKTVTPAEFAARTSLNPSDFAVLQGWLTSKGFTVSSIDNARLTIKFSGSVGDVESAFHTEIHNYQAKDGSIHFGNATTVQMPRALLAAVAKLTGLENFTPFYVKSYGGPVSDFAAKGVTALEPNAPKMELHLSGDPASDFSFTASKASIHLNQTVTLNVRIADASYEPTGSLIIKGDKGVIGGIADISSCAAVNGSRGRSCSVEVALPQVGMNRLTAVYGGNNNLRSMRQSLVIPRVGTDTSYTAETAIPTVVSTTASITYTTVTTWVGNAQAVGSVTAYYYLDYPDFYTGAATYPAAGQTTTTGSGTSTFNNAYTYSCTTSTAVKTVTCSITQSKPYTDIGGYGPYSIEATYSGDANYGTSEQDFADVDPVRRAASFTPTITFGNTLANQIYGNGVAESQTTTVTTTGGGNPGGASTTYPGIMQIYEGNQLGTVNSYSYNGACTGSTAWTCGPYALTWTNEPILAPGTYNVVFYFSGNTDGAGAALTLGPGSNTSPFTVSQQAPTATTTMPTAAAPTTQAFGALAAFTVKGKLAWTGSGNAPTQSDITFTSTADGSLGAVTCTNAGTTNVPATPYTCTATFTPTATDAAGMYNVNLSFSGDANYSAAAATVADNYIITAPVKTTPVLGALTFSPAATEPYGTLQAITISDSLTYVGTTPPTGAVTYVLNGVTYTATCTGTITPLSCSAVVPAATIAALPVAAYTVTSAYAGDTNYNSTTGPSGTFTITAVTPTVGITPSPVSIPYASVAGVLVTAKFTSATSAAPTGTATFTVTNPPAGTFGTASCTTSGSVLTCTDTYTPSGTAAVQTYTNAITVTLASSTDFGAATGHDDIVVTAIAPTDSLSAVTSPYGSTAGVSITATSNANGSTATFGTAGGVGGSFSPATCVITSGSCSVSYIPSGTLTAGTYTNDLTASFSATTDYNAGMASSTLTITAACGAGELCFTTVSHNFGQVQVGTAAAAYGIQISNHSTTTAYPFTLNFTATKGFTDATNCKATIAPGAVCELVFYFTPAANGPVSTTWSLMSESGFTYYPANGGLLQGSGTGGGGVSLTTPGHNFGTVSVGTTSPTYGTELSNSTTADVTLSLGTVSGPFTSATNCTTTLKAGASCELEFTFTPTTTSTVQQVYTLSAAGVTITSGGAALPNGGITLSGN